VVVSLTTALSDFAARLVLGHCVAEVAHLGDGFHHRHDESHHANETPGHGAVSPAALLHNWRHDAEVGGGGLHRVEQFGARHRVAGEVQRLETRCVVRACPLGQRDEGAREVRQVGPGVRHVARAGVHELAGAQRLDHSQVKPRALAAAVEVARSDDDGAQAPGAGAAGNLGFEVDAQAALLVRRTHWRVLAQHGRHVLAVTVDVARQHEQRAEPLGRVQALAGQRQQQPRPVGVDRVDGVNDHASAGRRGDQGLGVLERDREMPGPVRQAGRRATRLRQHGPASGGEGGHCGGAKASIGTKDESDGIRHGDSLQQHGASSMASLCAATSHSTTGESCN